MDALFPAYASRGSHVTGLPADLQVQSARRLRIVALLYAFVFFMSDPLTATIVIEDREEFLSSVSRWGPSTISIGAALFVVAITYQRRIAVRTVVALGLLFEVVGSLGIAAAEYLDLGPYATALPPTGLSWVAVWMLGFTIMIPSPPTWALVAALASAATVPAIGGLVLVTQGTSNDATPLGFFLQMVLPYLLVVLIAYVGARVVYSLGTELTRARELGAYRLVECLGRGGMGEVWRAQHRLLARPAAIKLMRHEQWATDLGRSAGQHARFEREAQATSSLRSPHTVELYDFGVADDGTFYYVMELLEGFDLQSLVERFGPLPAARAAHLLKQVCHSLGEAHSNGLVHRDIKPANVYVCRYGRDMDFVKVLDFGLVKPLVPEGLQPDITASHVLRGTPAFMSPEQVLGTQPLDARTDIYALGCLGYWLVTGQMVFTGRTAIETIVHHTQTKPIPPSERTDLHVPDALDRLILACLEKSPDDRPATVDAIAACLEAFSARAPWTPEQARQWWDAHHPAK